MKREALVPIDEQLEHDIARQQRVLAERWPGGTPVLFPQETANPDGHTPVSDGTYRSALHRWLERCEVRDEHGRPVKIVPHRWRHTLGTRLINRDVPQHVVQKILDHDSPLMTSHYARLNDATVRRHWEQARKVNARGQTVTLDPGGPLAEAAWAKQQVGRATQALPNGYCGLPVVQTCPHANACLTCPMFITTPEFLAQHHQHRQQVLQIISAAEARGHDRLAEMNRQVAGNLDKHHQLRSRPTPGQQERPMRPDNTAPLIDAARRRRELTRAKAIRALRELDHAGPRSPSSRRRGRRSLPLLALRPERHPRRDRPPPRHHSAGAVTADPRQPAGHRGSLLRRLAEATDRNRQLAEENTRLRRQLAHALGDQRASPAKHPDPARRQQTPR